MPTDETCPRCGAALQAPTVMHERFECSVHGPVSALHAAVLPTGSTLSQLAAGSDVPFWLPWPLPASWVFAGVRLVGGGRQPIDAAAIAVTGHGMSQGPSDAVIIAEKPGTGLGARWAGVVEPDPDLATRPATTKVRAGGWMTPLWHVDTPGRAVFVGEAAGCWLWFVAWPDTAWPALDDGLQLTDLRDGAMPVEPPTGALSPRLTE